MQEVTHSKIHSEEIPNRCGFIDRLYNVWPAVESIQRQPAESQQTSGITRVNNSAAQIDQQLAEAKEALLNAGWLGRWGTGRNILTIVQSIVDNVCLGDWKITTSKFHDVEWNHNIQRFDTGEVIFTLSRREYGQVLVTVTAESMEDLPTSI